MLTQERLKKILNYDPETGVFEWKTRTANCIHVGDVAGNNDKYGYWQIQVDGKCYFAHRLAWLYVYGVWPENHIDHIDGIKNNNRIVNLRDVTCLVNSQNQRNAHCINRVGMLGVEKHGGKFRARIRINGELKLLGTYSTPEAAHEVYLVAKRELHLGCTI